MADADATVLASTSLLSFFFLFLCLPLLLTVACQHCIHTEIWLIVASFLGFYFPLVANMMFAVVNATTTVLQWITG